MKFTNNFGLVYKTRTLYTLHSRFHIIWKGIVSSQCRRLLALLKCPKYCLFAFPAIPPRVIKTAENKKLYDSLGVMFSVMNFKMLSVLIISKWEQLINWLELFTIILNWFVFFKCLRKLVRSSPLHLFIIIYYPFTLLI